MSICKKINMNIELLENPAILLLGTISLLKQNFTKRYLEKS